jgi:patatin-like phospholipase/acyl hydrolase
MARYILSIDGGGLRGLVPALVLENLVRRIEARAGRAVELRQLFDLVAGTGTGALIAAGLTAPRKRGADTAALSPAALADLFRRDLRRACKRRFLSRGADDGRRLEDLLDRVLPPAAMGEALAPVLITACDLKTGAPLRLMSPAPYDWVDHDWYFRQAVRASMATPGVFEPTLVQNAVAPRKKTAMAGGEVWAADPTLAAVSEAFARDWEHDRLFVLSLGAGEPGDLAGRDGSLAAWSAQAQSAATSLQADHLLNRGGALQYGRINGPLARGADPYDASRAGLKRLEAAAGAWIVEHDRLLDGWAIRLAARAQSGVARAPVEGAVTLKPVLAAAA